MSTDGALPPWLKPPPSLLTVSASHRSSASNASTISGSSVYRTGSKSVSLQDIYDSAGSTQPPTTQSRLGRNQDLASDQPSTGRQPLAGDRLRNKLRPNARPVRASSPANQVAEDTGSGRGNYSGRSGFGGGDDYDPYSYQQPGGYAPANSQRDQKQGQYGGLPSRPNRR